VKLALAGDTMLGRLVGERLDRVPASELVAPGVVEAFREADVAILNLECAISTRGERWPNPAKPFFFRAPPRAVDLLTLLEVDCVTLANNHALDFGVEALLDTFEHLQAAGISWVGAGPDLVVARRPAIVEVGDQRVGVVAFTDHPAEFAAAPDRPGVAHVDLRRGVPGWVTETIGSLDTDVVVVSPHWGPNMTSEPVREVRAAAPELRRAGATLVAGHSAHVFHGVSDSVIFDMGDFLDDYAVDPDLRNDLGLMFLVTADGGRVQHIEAVPLALDTCHTRLADPDEERWIRRRFVEACRAMGTVVEPRDGRLAIDLEASDR
jgi:poly-gamma-glutamate capsule biosynthesis protein CapA/YwtB (metallophosphatase superfamily)